MRTSPSIVFCAPDAQGEPWLDGLREALPDARVEAWSEAAEPADYAVAWAPPDAFYATQPALKALFNLGAGVDALLRSPGLPERLPIVRLEDAGMAPLMAEYVLHAVVRHVRELDRMDDDRRAGRWAPRRSRDRGEFPVGVMGAGALGVPVATMLAAHGFPVALWSRTPKSIEGLRSFGAEAFDAFLAATRVLVCVLPLTSDTEDIIDRTTLGKLRPEAYVVNVARGRHVVDADLLAAIAEGGVVGATLDVFREEPLPPTHPFWAEPAITITPHCAALTQRSETIRQIAEKIARLERGEPVGGIVDRTRGY